MDYVIRFTTGVTGHVSLAYIIVRWAGTVHCSFTSLLTYHVTVFNLDGECKFVKNKTLRTHARTHAHAHTHPFNGPLSGTTRVGR